MLESETLYKYLREQALQQERETRAREAQERMHRIEETAAPSAAHPDRVRSAEAQPPPAHSARPDDTPTADSEAAATADASENFGASTGPEANEHEDQPSDTETTQHDHHADAGAETDQAARDTTDPDTGL